MEAMEHRKETKIRHTGRGVSLDEIGESKSARDASTPVIRLDAGRTSGICCVVQSRGVDWFSGWLRWRM